MTVRRDVRILMVVSVTALALIAASVCIHAADNDEGEYDAPTFVSPPREPTEVSVGAYLVGLSRMSDPSESFPTYDVEMFLNLSWKDPRVAFGDPGARAHVFQEEEAEEKLSEIWSPDIEIQNEIEQRRTESIELTILPDGSVDYEERFSATLNAELDLRRFPFDKQLLDMEIQSFVWDSRELSMVVNEAQTGFDADFDTPEWKVTAIDVLISSQSEIRDDREFSSFRFRIHAKRHSGHYLLRFMLPLVFIMTLTWFAFWEPLEDRFRVGFIALLTVVATHTVISRSLPRLNYATFADAVLILCYLVATALITVSIVAKRIEAGGAPERAQRINQTARRLLPVVAVVALVVVAVLLWN